MRLSISMALTVLVTCAPATAGNVLRVGPGRPHTTIGAAVAAAQHGDLILVDAGTYPPFAIVGKSVSVLADTTPFSVQAIGSQPALRIAAIPGWATVSVCGLSTFVTSGSAPPVQIVGCAGSVRLRDVLVTPNAHLTAAAFRAPIEVIDSLSVWLHGVMVWPAVPYRGNTSMPVTSPTGPDDGLAAVLAERSNVHLQNVWLRGFDNPADGKWGGDALRLLGESSALIHGGLPSPRSQLVAGDGGGSGGSAVHLIATAPVQNVNSCGQTGITAGSGPVAGGLFSINHDGGVVWSGPTQFSRAVPTCLGVSLALVTAPPRAPVGSVHPITVTTLYARPYALMLGPTRFRAVRLPGVENFALLDYATGLPFAFAAGSLPALTSVQVNLPVPAAPVLIGVQVGVQAILGRPSGASVPAWSFSHAEMLVVTP